MSASAALAAPPDTIARPQFRHAAYVGVHSAEYGGGSHYASLNYEWWLSPRVSVRAGIGGVHRSYPVYTEVFDPVTGRVSYEEVGQHRYNSLLLTSQVRYFLWPARRPAAGLFVGAGLQLVFEEFQQPRTSYSNYVSDIQVHVPLSTRIGYQLRKGRWLLSGSTGLDFTRRDEVQFDPQRPGQGGREVHVTAGSDLQVGFLF
ncbi:hypothetical protein J0X19_11225 [Hymenobacter sp. BT186]|uniref:Uncharacterized protein n=2 Tax=Hymenobacter telluris TaxID=2816474 RepID=A0A939EW47_9BACT|nr:hypothetical protein [Hymenobacter telluris]MBW3374544.1 hypothetical protein [Hymenobacter norwichensis]